jgi:LysM repeat protein
MRSGTAARILAPLSLLASFTAVVLIVTGSGQSPQTSSAQPAAATAPAPKSDRHYWIVHTGHTLSEIATRTGVPAQRIRALNPGKDLETLHPGERIKVR